MQYVKFSSTTNKYYIIQFKARDDLLPWTENFYIMMILNEVAQSQNEKNQLNESLVYMTNENQ